MTDRLGMGAMIALLGGNQKSVEAFTAAKGKTISALQLLAEGDGALHFDFTDGTAVELYDDARSCCESRYLHTDDDLAYHVGATLESAETREGPSLEAEYGDVKECLFLVVTTSKGQFTVAAYNEHNGYYGGIMVRARTANTLSVLHRGDTP